MWTNRLCTGMFFAVSSFVSSSASKLNKKFSTIVNHAFVKPISSSQQQYHAALLDDSVPMVVAYGPAGCGKTLLACDAFVRMYQQGKYSRMILTRPSVPVEGENLGFLPGNVQTKMAPWTQPVFDLLANYYSSSEIHSMIQKQIIDVIPLAFMRGRSFHKAFIIGDEMQNSGVSQWKTLISRCGLDSKMVLTGDLAQSDLSGLNGLDDFLFKHQSRPFSSCQVVELKNDSICRSPLVRDYLDWMGGGNPGFPQGPHP